jgi:hypothetical protein
MRKRIPVLFLAALAAAIIVPVGFALSLEQAPEVQAPRVTAAAPAAAIVMAPLQPAVVNAPVAAWALGDVPEAARLFVVGTSLFGLAFVVRKAT